MPEEAYRALDENWSAGLDAPELGDDVSLFAQLIALTDLGRR
jgi:hypothetical protein